MKRLLKFPTFLVSLIILTGCATSPPKSVIDFDPSYDFRGKTKLAWLSDPAGLVAGDIPIENEINNQIKAALGMQLTKNGFRLVTKDSTPDLLISYTIGGREDLTLNQIPTEIYENREEWLWGTEYHPHLFHLQNPDDSYVIRKAVFALDVYDANSGQPVWHSKISKLMDSFDEPPRAEDIQSAVMRVLEGFPPGN